MPTTVQAVAESHLTRQKRIATQAATKLARLWRRTDPARMALSWQQLLSEALAVLAQGQTQAAIGSAAYVEAALLAQGVTGDPVASLSPTMLAGIASDGRDLRSLLYQPVIAALVAIKGGATPARARAIGLNRVVTIARTQISDAGRGAESIGITIRPQVSGYVRMLSLPSCSRCVILAGKWYEWDTGFLRHPLCDCLHIPARENVAGDLSTNPKSAFDSMTPEQQDRAFTKAGAEAIRDGADISKVVNARRGVTTATVFGKKVLATREGARRGPVRLMPEQIYREANGNREDAIRLLRLHGYVR